MMTEQTKNLAVFPRKSLFNSLALVLQHSVLWAVVCDTRWLWNLRNTLSKWRMRRATYTKTEQSQAQGLNPQFLHHYFNCTIFYDLETFQGGSPGVRTSMWANGLLKESLACWFIAGLFSYTHSLSLTHAVTLSQATIIPFMVAIYGKGQVNQNNCFPPCLAKALHGQFHQKEAVNSEIVGKFLADSGFVIPSYEVGRVKGQKVSWQLDWLMWFFTTWKLLSPTSISCLNVSKN